MEILITEQVHHEITVATRKGREQSLEFGGSLMAHERDGEILVAYALPTGPCAKQGPGHVRTDVDFQNRAINRIRRSMSGLYYAGDWHVHPMWMPYLSSTDRRTARAILKEDGSHLTRLVLLLGTARPKGEPIVAGFLAELDGAMEVDTREVELRCVASDSKEVLLHLGCPLRPLEELLGDTSSADGGIDLDAVVHIERDLDELRRELNAEITLWTNDDLLGAVVRQESHEAVVLFPPEYPLGAPQIFAGSLRDGPLQPVPLYYGWSSLHRLVEPVAEALTRQIGGHSRRSCARSARGWWPFSRLWAYATHARSERNSHGVAPPLAGGKRVSA